MKTLEESPFPLSTCNSSVVAISSWVLFSHQVVRKRRAHQGRIKQPFVICYLFSCRSFFRRSDCGGLYAVQLGGERVAGACRCRVLYDNTTARSCAPRYRTLSTMATTSAGNFVSIFKEGNLKPGIYKNQGLYAQTYTDTYEHSREVCVDRPQLSERGEGRGLVCPFQQPAIHVPDD